MKEFVYILPIGRGGVVNVVNNLIYYSQFPNIKKKVILYGLDSNRAIGENVFPCDEQIELVYSRYAPKYYIAKQIAKHITKDSIIISNDGAHELEMLSICKLNNPVIYIMHGDNPYYQSVVQHKYPFISEIITVSSYLQEVLQKLQIPVNISFVRFPVPCRGKQLPVQKSYDILQISYIGALIKQKGCEYFKTFIDKLKKSGIPFIFNIGGSGGLEEKLKTDFKEYPEVIFHGQLTKEDVDNIYGSSVFSVLFSQAEGLPVTVVEAMQNGCIPIVFNIASGIPDIIQNEVDGFIVEQGNVDEVVSIIKRLYIDRELMRKIALRAALKVAEQFNPTIQTLHYEQIFLNATSISGRKISIWKKLSFLIPSPLLYQIEKIRSRICK